MKLFNNRTKRQSPAVDVAALYEKTFPKIYRFFYYKVLSKQVAEDLTSETFVSFMHQIHKELEIKDYQRFLYGIARNVFGTYLRRKYRQGIQVNLADFENYLDEYLQVIENEPLEDIARHYIELLPEKQKVVLTMRLLDKLSLSEIAQKLNKNINYVKVTQRRGIKQLKKLHAYSRTPLTTNTIDDQ